MTDQEWLQCDDPIAMLEFLRGKASERKLRLVAVACCRRIWPHLTEKRSRWMVEVSERYADDRVKEERLIGAWEKADAAFKKVHLCGGGDVDQHPAQAVIGLGLDLQIYDVMEFAAATLGAVARGEAYEQIWKTPGKDNGERWAEDDALRIAAQTQESRAQASLVREIFGNPRHPVASTSAWLSPTVVNLAQTIYDQKAFDRLPILSDALEEAGCTNQEILNHCRQSAEHVRGCWPVDLLLGKK